MNTHIYFLILAMLLALLPGCAEKIEVVFPANAYEYGFFSGLWHGFIAPFSLIGIFFDMDVVVFATKNTVLSYGLGFLIGSGGWGILASNARKKRN